MTGLQIGVAGAGIAGLSAAIALRRAGHQVEIFERSQFRNEVGAAASIPPNGGRILERWGFDSAKAGGTQNILIRRPKGDTLEQMLPSLDFSDCEATFDTKWFFYHRSDIHHQLKQLASSPDLPGQPAKIHLGAQVMDVDAELGTITIKDGSVHQYDLVIIADGQHDLMNAKITGEVVPMQRSGQTAFRCLIPLDAILSDPVTAPLFKDIAPGFWAPTLPQKGVMVVTYPCRDNKVLNAIAVSRKLATAVATEHEVKTIEDWNFSATHDDLNRVLDGFHPHVKAVMLKSPEVKVYTQMKRQPLRCLTKGKALLIGDAAHPMLLTHAQGVSSSIEDAAALEVFFSNLDLTSSVESPASATLLERLKLFESLRLPRTAATQLLTDPVMPGPGAAAKQDALVEEIRKYYSGPLPPKDAMPHSPPICKFFFAYDVTKDAEKTLADHQAGAAPASDKTTIPVQKAPAVDVQTLEVSPPVLV